ncbi:hypothetical protein B0H14DRAFT_2602160 [Mycena olivaceomarginata]|nr:hypothetical protein B0H14DRAFT_2602160 [Mycena olivaceomarginata]
MSALRTVRRLTKLRLTLLVPLDAVASPRPRRFKGATTLLAQKLRAEVSYEAEVEQDNVQVGAVPLDLVGFLQEGGWEIQDTPHPHHVLHRGPSVHPQQGGPEATDNEGATRGDEPALRVPVAITKPTHLGALHADLYCADGTFDVANVVQGRARRDRAEHCKQLTEKDVVDGAFESLDSALNGAFEAYLRERVAGLVPRYALWKEQREYLEWLHGVEGFVKA